MISLNIEKDFLDLSPKKKVSAYESRGKKAAQENAGKKELEKGTTFLGWLHLPSSISKRTLG